MPECERLSGGSDWSDREVVERGRPSTSISERGIRRHLGGVSTRIASQVRGELGVEWSHGAVHSRVQKADLQLTSDAAPNQIAVDETVSRPTGENDWLSAAVGPRATRSSTSGCFGPLLSCLPGSFSANSVDNCRSSRQRSSSMASPSCCSSTVACSSRCCSARRTMSVPSGEGVWQPTPNCTI